MSFFLFSKQLIDMLYRHKFLDYIMVGMVLLLLVYQTLLVRPQFKKWCTVTDGLVFLMGILLTLSFFKDFHAYESFFKVASAFLMYYLGRIYYERIQECYGSLVSAAYLIVYLNLFHRISAFGWRLFEIKDAGGDLYYYDTDMAFAMILAMVFITMFGKNTIFKLITIFLVCPYMVFWSDAGIQKILMLVIYAIVGIYIIELVFRGQKITSLLLALMIMGIILVVGFIYLPVMGYENRELVGSLFHNQLLDYGNMHVRYGSWENILAEFGEKNLISRLLGAGLDAGIVVESLYIKLVYVMGYAGLVLALGFIGYITYYVVKIKDRKTFYLAVSMAVMLLGTGVTVNSMECVQMSWFPMLFAGMVVSSVKEEEVR